MRPTIAKRSHTIALSVYGASRPNKKDCYTRHPFFENRFTYSLIGGKVVFKESVFKGRKFLIDKSGAYKGDISVKGFPSGEFVLQYDSENNRYFIEVEQKVKNWTGNIFSAQGTAK